MAASEPVSDPLKEYDKSRSELADLEKQFADKKIPEKEFESLSKELREKILGAESRIYAMARKDELLAKKLRLRNYNDPMVQQVVDHFTRTGERPLEPEFGADRFPRYPLETGGGDASSAAPSFLQRMADIGIITETLFERIPYCPKCAAPSNVYLHLKCTQCGSIDVSINRMIEHLQCGTIHQESALRADKNMVCPTCKKPRQKAEEYRSVGVVCSCNACRAHFEDPAQGFFCRKCKTDFDLTTATLVDVFAYNMRQEVLNEVRQNLAVNDLARSLRQIGFEVKVPGALAGPKKEVVFSLLAEKGSKAIAVDLSQSHSEVDVEPVLELYLKTLEVNPTAVIFGAIPRLSERARDVAARHNISVVEDSSPTELGKKVIEIVERI